jgi:hypothetical protein
MANDPLLFIVSQGTVYRETLTEYITFKRGGAGEGSLYSCTPSLASCIGLFVRIVTKSSRVGPLLIFSISLGVAKRRDGRRKERRISVQVDE